MLRAEHRGRFSKLRWTPLNDGTHDLVRQILKLRARGDLQLLGWLQYQMEQMGAAAKRGEDRMPPHA